MRPTLLALAAGGVLLCLGANADDTKDQTLVKEIPLKELRLERPKDAGLRPLEIRSDEELARVFPFKESQETIKKEVDFNRHKLVFFSWAGSGQDRLTASVGEEGGKKEVLFGYQRGRTKDRRQHARLFVVRKDIAYRLAQ
jgi:hypothetical protein